jgi:ABC-type bacteriocin/lantibiotic exporter with double-glycine peptidase domain
MALLVVLTGVSALIGLGLLLLLVPLQFYFAALITRFRNKNIAITDVRVSIMHEVLLAIKLVKFYAWEQSFADKVAETRNKELKWMKRSSWVKYVGTDKNHINQLLILSLSFYL